MNICESNETEICNGWGFYVDLEKQYQHQNEPSWYSIRRNSKYIIDINNINTDSNINININNNSLITNKNKNIDTDMYLISFVKHAMNYLFVIFTSIYFTRSYVFKK